MGIVEQSFPVWIALSPERVEGELEQDYRSVLDAFGKFRVEDEKGTPKSAAWVKEHCLDDWPQFVTWIAWDAIAKEVNGCFSVGKVRPGRHDLGPVPFEAHQKPTSEIKNIRRKSGSLLLGEDQLMRFMVVTAAELWESQEEPEATIILDPWGSKLRHRHDFWSDCRDKRRIWSRFELPNDGSPPKSIRP